MMRNLVGDPVTVGAIQMRAATAYLFGGVIYTGVVQRLEARDRWSPGTQCRHRHQDADSALTCAQGRLDELAGSVTLLAAERMQEALSS